jgi:hypothetical protein
MKSRDMLLWLAPRDVCALMAAEGAQQRVLAAARKRYGQEGDGGRVEEAMAAFHTFYEHLYAQCVAGQAEEQLDRHRLVRVPRSVYGMLRALGFCGFAEEGAGDELRSLHSSDGTPVCLFGGIGLRQRWRGLQRHLARRRVEQLEGKAKAATEAEIESLKKVYREAPSEQLLQIKREGSTTVARRAARAVLDDRAKRAADIKALASQAGRAHAERRRALQNDARVQQKRSLQQDVRSKIDDKHQELYAMLKLWRRRCHERAQVAKSTSDLQRIYQEVCATNVCCPQDLGGEDADYDAQVADVIRQYRHAYWQEAAGR